MEQLKRESGHVFHEVTESLRFLIEARPWPPAVGANG